MVNQTPIDLHPAYVLMGIGFVLANLGFWPLFLQLTEVSGGMGWRQPIVMAEMAAGEHGSRHQRRFLVSAVLFAVGSCIAMCGGVTQP